MRIQRTLARTGALLVLLASTASAQVHEGKTIVSARLVADVTSVQPGRPFTVGVHLTVAPGWHVYWENPGDTALPIQVGWELPAGVTSSSLRWPQPERYQEDGGVTVFGYERETMLLSTISPPSARTDGPLVLKAKADWLVCEKLCIPGEASLTLTLPAGDGSPSPEAASIASFAAKVPKAGADAGVKITTASVQKGDGRWTFTLNVDAGGRRVVRFFPRTIDGFMIDHGKIAVTGSTIRFSAEPDDERVSASRLTGVIVTNRGSFDVSAPLTPGAAAELPAAVQPPVKAADSVAGASSASTDPAAAVVASAPPTAMPSVPSDDWLARDFTTSGASTHVPFGMLLLFAALGGLLLNIMPCVLPVISLKILGFVHQAGHDPRRTRLLGLMFAAGVILSFWILVAAIAIVRATGEQIGWGFQFQSPVFVLAMSVIVLVFAMSLFGVFEISGPALSGSAAGGQGPGGAFAHGMLATVLATPCTAPFLGTAIGFAFTQSLGVLFLAFTASAVGLALPYVLLSWHPGWLRWLPKPGAWMIRFKQAMGFVLLATVVWLLSVLGAQLGPEGVVWSLVFLVAVGFAVWMIGQIPHAASRGVRVGWQVAALAIAAGTYVWAMESELRWREPVSDISTETSSGGTPWERFSLADLQQRVERGETVFVDFTADWCWSCKVNERTVLASSGVQARIRDLNVTTVKADWTRRNPEITRLLAKFGRVGVPFYVVFPANRLTEPIALSEVITPASVIDALDRAGPSLAARAPDGAGL